ncbi:unnamed protein product [Rhodiola kirilowii]
MNLKGKLIIVAAIGRPWDEDLNNGFSIWLLKGKDWQEISRITHTCFYCSDPLFGYSCSGADDLNYLHDLHPFQLLSSTCCFRHELETMERLSEVPHMRVGDLFNGFCFLPRLDISP